MKKRRRVSFHRRRMEKNLRAKDGRGGEKDIGIEGEKASLRKRRKMIVIDIK